MANRGGFDYRNFQPWQRSFEIGYWVLMLVLNALFNSINAHIEHPELPAWRPAVWECSSALMLLALVPMVVAIERRWPFRFDSWQRSLPWHIPASVVFSLLHVGGMIALRVLAYGVAGYHYHFGPWWPGLGYEYLKDVRTYAGFIVAMCLYRLVLMRLQGEARLLAEPDEGPPLEPVERPERFLVRKLGKEFLIAAREIEWVQASGNYVNLHVRGRDYPLRATMAGIEGRLDPARFIRVHRSYFINLDYLLEIEPLETGDARLQLLDGTKVPCSRRYRAQLRERFGAVPIVTV
ncbi:LytTR family DNA-binding domain-containing protein [Dyella tabacisoli]|uniref:LytTR family transcriptional regulator n=1 Tax=Dyella tabacisoli TaxID=2282381 RepID=A0A369UJP0_9GAMM|nr:LytTR family DNA-binding domain-containing protein [Dyella tabacisoli]RDD80335.1 LytTR family transcriptional regulator [Dyella tabacisoli]